MRSSPHGRPERRLRLRRRFGTLKIGAFLLGLASLAMAGCDASAGCNATVAKTTSTASQPADPSLLEAQEDEAAEARRQARLDREWPLHGLVTGLQLVIRKEPNPDSAPVGFLRIGSRVRLRGEPEKSPTCASGWYRALPEGWACSGEGILIGERPPEGEFEVPPPKRDVPLPYTYWFVKEPMVPEYHRPPSRDEQRAALAYAEHYLELLAKNEKRAERFLAGEGPGGPPRPAVVHRFLNRGFYVAGVGVEVRARRAFVRTVRGRYIKQAQLLESTGSDFHGVELGPEHSLPVAWAVRTARPMIRRDRADGTVRFVDDPDAEPIERLTLLTHWKERENIGGRFMHVLDGDRYLRDWFVSVARVEKRPKGVGAEEPWVHVNLTTQTLVTYQGDRPTYATLISSGVEGHETPSGLFEVERKYIADTMADLGASLDDRYSIEDVPWTQYFVGSIALHAAFWHSRFGLPKSHGCVNLAPQDAQWVFRQTWPTVPEGWLGVVTDLTPFPASHILVTP
ncbi:MAG: L,D-transpeptidase [Myxococcales bacterium]|nr:L,D-transpeptidase [Myxococcales bacterium]